MKVVIGSCGERSDVGGIVCGLEFVYGRDDDDGDGEMIIVVKEEFSNFY